MIIRFLEFLHDLDLKLTSREIADILWLATKISPPTQDKRKPALQKKPQEKPAEPPPQSPPPSAPEDNQPKGEAFLPQPESTEKITSGIGGLAFRSPAAPALSGTLELGRALRPLMRKVPSHNQMVFDEEATVKRIAEEDKWIPVLRSALSRWLDVVLVIDRAPSMVIWRQTIAELRYFLAQHGAFRTVQTWEFVAEADNKRIFLYPGSAHNGTQPQFPHHPNELIDPYGQRVYLIISDCVSPAWRNGTVIQLLSSWERHGMVSIVQMLPQRLWRRSAFGKCTSVRLHTQTPAPNNAQLEAKLTRRSFRKKTKVPVGLKIPVLTLESNFIALWAKFAAGVKDIWMPGFILPAKVPETSSVEEQESTAESSTSLSFEEHIKLFRSRASSEAWDLLCYLSVVPLSLPTMRLVQRVMLPKSHQTHLAEVFLSGLIKRKSSDALSLHPDAVLYDFIDQNIRDYLERKIRVSETVEVLTAVSELVARKTGSPLDFQALLANPSATEKLVIEEGSLPFARVTINTLHSLGGRYAQLANRLEQRIEDTSKLSDVVVPQETIKETLITKTDLQQTHAEGISEKEVITNDRKPISSKETLTTKIDLRKENAEEISEKEVILKDRKPVPSVTKDGTGNFSWLHLTDLHCGIKKQHWFWPGVREIFFDDLKKLHDKCGPWDLVLFTGDLTQQGSAEEFRKVDEVLERLWAYLNQLGSSPKLLAVPGNHDLVRPSVKEPAVRLLQQWSDHSDIQEEFWEDENSRYRQVVTQAFEHYTSWWNGQTLKVENFNPGILPGDFSSTIEKDGAKLGIVGLNTSFLQLTDDNYEGKIALHARQFHDSCGSSDGPTWAKQHHACLLLTHHSPIWLSPDSQRYLHEEITDHARFVSHLCGHMHETMYREIAEGGTETRRLWQGRSLFGLEYFGDKKDRQRSHGYTVGRIELSDDKGSLLFWPREARLQGSQRNIVPDFSIVLNDNQHTTPQKFELLQPLIPQPKSFAPATTSVNFNDVIKPIIRAFEDNNKPIFVIYGDVSYFEEIISGFCDHFQKRKSNNIPQDPIKASFTGNEQRLDQQIKNLQKEWDLFDQRLTRLRKQCVLESQVDEKFRLEKVIAETTNDLDRVEQALQNLEAQHSSFNKNAENIASRNGDRSQNILYLSLNMEDAQCKTLDETISDIIFQIADQCIKKLPDSNEENPLYKILYKLRGLDRKKSEPMIALGKFIPFNEFVFCPTLKEIWAGYQTIIIGFEQFEKIAEQINSIYKYLLNELLENLEEVDIKLILFVQDEIKPRLYKGSGEQYLKNVAFYHCKEE